MPDSQVLIADDHAVTLVGVDVSLAAQTPWLAHQLQFVAGLGPRKATSLLKAVQRQEQVASRKEELSTS